ncbi:MAG: hypothetical protein O3A49_06935 [Candidatus Marinimicrobia bacterium]|nr:hypothetical protein [Candidatus Neomarinimicrobiota bacterium]
MIHVRCARLATRVVRNHWERTVLQKIPIDEIRNLLTQNQIQMLTKNGGSEFHFWGDTDATLAKTKGIKTGENIIFYGENSFHLKAKAGPVFTNEELAKYFWSSTDDGLAWKNIYVLEEVKDLSIAYKASDFLLRDGSPRLATNFQSGAYLEGFQLMPEFLSKLEIGWEEGVVSDEHTKRGIPRDTPINQAQIYEVTFSVDGKNMIYVGQDLKCEENYFGSSLVIYHFQKLYGKEIFSKRIIENLTNVTKGEINDIESKYIAKSKKSIEGKDNWFSINYTGENQRLIN